MNVRLRPLLSRLYVNLIYGRRGFCPDAYMKRYPDVAEAGADPYDHFARHGRAEGRRGVADGAADASAHLSRVARLGTSLATMRRDAALGERVRPLLSRVVLRVQGGFSADAYLKMYPDLAVAGVDPYEHFARHGRAEGRFGVFPALPVDAGLDTLGRERETVLVVCHDGTRTGAPVLGYNLVRRLRDRYNVVAMFLGSGPMLDACRDVGAVVVGPVPSVIRNSPAYADHVVERIAAAAPIRFALVNSIESRHVLAALARRHVPTVSLVHEFAVDTRPRGAFREAALWSGEVVFSSAVTRDNAIAECPDLGGREYPIVPQGRCSLPREPEVRPERAAQEEARVARAMRPADFPADGFVVLGAGTVYFRKGVDLFLDCAARVLRRVGDLPVRFVWVGKVPDHERAYGEFLADQVRRAGLERHVHFLDEVADLDPVYARADALLLSSRLDPLPNVAIDAVARGLPLVCFENTTGMAEILRRHGLAASCVAGYLDTEDAAEKLAALALSSARREDVGKQCAGLAAEFDMDAYVQRLEALASRDADRVRGEQEDLETISRAGVLRLDYHVPPRERPAPAHTLIESYVRSWATGILRRKLFPGFHPGIYREQHGVARPGADPLADYLRAGRPEGPWAFELVTPAPARTAVPPRALRAALHVHAHYPDLLPAMLERLERNTSRPDLFVSVSSATARREVEAHLRRHGGKAQVREVPNRGRDIGPLLTEFGAALREYDVFGHLHTKKTLHALAIGKDWYEFLLENLLGGEAPMVDAILDRMAADPRIGIVFPDDPNVNGWDRNLPYVEKYLAKLGIERPPREFAFPIGTMFWARPVAVEPLLDLELGWDDYPQEPLPIDGTMLHGLERLFGVVAARSGYRVVLTHVPGRTR